MKTKLDPYEQEIEDSMDSYEPVSEKERDRILSNAAKTKTVSLRINETVLHKIRQKAQVEGLPYQTLISSVLYKYATDRLLEEDKVRKVVEVLHTP